MFDPNKWKFRIKFKKSFLNWSNSCYHYFLVFLIELFLIFFNISIKFKIIKLIDTNNTNPKLNKGIDRQKRDGRTIESFSSPQYDLPVTYCHPMNNKIGTLINGKPKTINVTIVSIRSVLCSSIFFLRHSNR